MKACRNCKFSTIGSFDREWKVTMWYCLKRKEIVPEFITIICKEYEEYEPNLHDDNCARSSPQTRDNGIHQEE